MLLKYSRGKSFDFILIKGIQTINQGVIHYVFLKSLFVFNNFSYSGQSLVVNDLFPPLDTIENNYSAAIDIIS